MQDIEKSIRTIEGREYVFVEHAGTKVLVQDFVRFPHVVPLEEEEDLSPQIVRNLRQNSRRANASSATHGQFETVWITGNPTWPILERDGETAIGVGEACMSELVSHAVATDLTGITLGQVSRGPRHLPIGLFEVASDSRVVDLWASRGSVGIYRRHVKGNHVVKRLSSAITTELYAADPAATAVQYAVKYLGARRIFLTTCDATFPEHRDGSVSFGDRYIYPRDHHRVATLHAVCCIAERNHIEISWVEGTMAAVPCARAVDNRIEGQP